MSTTRPTVCFHCNVTDDDKPLLHLTLGGSPAYICPQCLPILIHHPDKLTGLLVDMMEASRASGKQ